MKYTFKLPEFPLNTFELQTPAWKGKSALYIDGNPVEQSVEKGEPYLIPDQNGGFIKAFPKYTLPDSVPALEINGNKIMIAEKLKLLQYILGALPVVLMFIGGAIGGATGVAAALLNFKIFRQEGSDLSKYLKVMGINIAAVVVFALIAGSVQLFFNK